MKGHLRERSPGHWAIVIDLHDTATGKRKRKWFSFAGSKRQAQIECARLISEQQRGTLLEPSKTTLAQYLDRWLADVKTRVSPKTIECYQNICRKNLMPLLGAVVLSNLKPVQISAAYTKALTSGRRRGGGGLSSRTVHHMHVVLKSALAQAVKWELLVRNPANAVNPPRVERQEMMSPDADATATLIEAARGTTLFVPILLGALCGIRRSEITALRWRSVDSNGGSSR
jgi:site-specific recombinase XerC